MIAKIYVTTPEGQIAIVKNKIVAILDVSTSLKSPKINTRIYVDGNLEPFNITEHFEQVIIRI